MKKKAASKSGSKAEASHRSSSKKKDFLVVGLGASAGGVRALQKFFAAMPPANGMAFVAVLHLSPEHESNLAAILQAQTAMPVTQVTETVKVEPDNVYVISPNLQLEMVDGVLRPVKSARPPRGERVVIDVFFRTLAEAYGENAVCIVLSGTGTDGTSGLKRVKEANGFAVVQDPKDAEYDSMPLSAIGTRLADWILPVSEMPEKLLSYKKSSERLHLNEPGADANKIAEEIRADESLREIMTLLRVRTGHDFSNYKTPTLVRRIARHLQIHELEDIPSYLELLRHNPDEIQSLLKNLLINVTNFFRDKQAFEALEAEVIPKIFEGKKGKDTVRVWSAGCASGEEAYSLAILLREFADRLADPPKFQVFATDMDEDAVQQAREGRYPEAIEADVSNERLKRFFVKDGECYFVKKDLRETILFAPHNILRDPPFSRLDLISCRNLLIYLNRETQGRVLQIFHFALKADGILFLGSSESAESSAELFAPHDKKHRIYSRRPAPPAHKSLAPLMPVVGLWEARLPETKSNPAAHRAATLGEIHYRLLEDYAPPSVLVNQEFDIVYLSGAAGRFLRFSRGEPSNNLLKTVNPALLPDLRAALFTARREHQSARFTDIRATIGGEEIFVDLIVRTVDAADEASDYLLVIFDEHGGDDESGESADAGGARRRKKTEREDEKTAEKTDAMEKVVRRLEEDLQRTREHLHLTIENHETALEEHKAANEELQATVEELRSSSEELETSKEEIQSVNEELSTVNYELKDKMEETSRANSDLQNLMAATDIATIFLDRNLRIKRFTPPAEELFNITRADTGRPLAHFTHQLRRENPVAEAEKVLRTLTPVEHEIEAANNRVYLARFLPYRTIDDRIEGVVLNFIDITERKRVEKDLRASEEKYRTLFDSIDEGFVEMEMLMDDAGRVVDWRWIDFNPAFERMSGLKSVKGQWFSEIVPELEPEWAERYGHVVATGEALRFELPVGGLDKWFDIFVSRIGGAGSRRIAVVFNNITERKRREAHQNLLVEIGDDLSRLAAPDEIMQAVGARLGAALGLTNCVFADVDEERGEITVHHAWNNGGVPSLKRTFRIEDYLSPAERAGGAVVVRDALTDERLDAKRYERLKIGAFVTVPFYRDGRWTANFGVSDSKSRDWTEDEIELFREICDRVFPRIERARAEEALRESEERLRDVLDSMAEGFALLGSDFTILDVNRETLRLDGRARKELIGRSHWDAFPGTEDSPVGEIFRRVVREGTPASLEHEYRWSDEKSMWIDMRAYPTRDGGVAIFWRDITSRKRAEEALRESEERLRLVVQSVTDYAIITIDAGGAITGWNAGAEKIFGWRETEALGQPADIIFTPEDRHANIPADEMKTALRKGRTEDDRLHVRRDGSRFPVSGVLTPFLENGKNVRGFVKIARDITERIEAEKAVRDKEMLQKLVGAQETERKRIARDLHDELGQQLTGLRLKLDAARKMCEENTELCGKIDEIELIAEAIDHGVDFLAWELRPAALDDLGLVAALQNYVNQWSRHSGVSAELIASRLKRTRFAPEVETNLYRIVQEALNNVHKHAGAKSVEIVLEKRDDFVVLIIADDGGGFKPKHKKNLLKGLGLTGMKERAALVGGEVEIESAPGAGTTVFVRIPASSIKK